MIEKFKNIIFGFLRGSITHEPHFMHNFIIIYFPDFEDEYENPLTLMEYDYDDGRLWIEPEWFKYQFLNRFGLNFEKGTDIITEWFENYFGVKVKFVEL
jgi:hypothetical protein